MAREPARSELHRYNPGTTAYELAPKKAGSRGRLPQQKKSTQGQIVLRVDVLALVSILVAVLMLGVMTLGVVRYQSLLRQEQLLAGQVTQLTQEHQTLYQRYHSSLDLDAIRERALAAGYIPLEEATHVPIPVAPTPPPREPDLWQQILDFFGELFA